MPRTAISAAHFCCLCGLCGLVRGLLPADSAAGLGAGFTAGFGAVYWRLLAFFLFSFFLIKLVAYKRSTGLV